MLLALALLAGAGCRSGQKRGEADSPWLVPGIIGAHEWWGKDELADLSD